MNLNSKPSNPFHGCFGRFAGDASEPIDFHSAEWTHVRNKRGKENQISKSNSGSSNWRWIPNEQVNFAVAPKGTEQTYSSQENKKLTSGKQSLFKKFQGKGNQEKKPTDVTQRISHKKLDMMLKQMMSNDKILSETGRCIDENIKNLQEQVQKSVTATKALDSLNKILLQFEMDRCRKTFWNVEPKQNPWSMPKKIPLQRHISKPLEQLMQTNECFRR
jgi:hypothetical protein